MVCATRSALSSTTWASIVRRGRPHWATRATRRARCTNARAIDGPPLTELTILAEFFNPDFLREKNLPLPPWMQ